MHYVFDVCGHVTDADDERNVMRSQRFFDFFETVYHELVVLSSAVAGTRQQVEQNDERQRVLERFSLGCQQSVVIPDALISRHNIDDGRPVSRFP